MWVTGGGRKGIWPKLLPVPVKVIPLYSVPCWQVRTLEQQSMTLNSDVLTYWYFTQLIIYFIKASQAMFAVKRKKTRNSIQFRNTICARKMKLL